jgi:hypothetical protein
MKYDFNIAKCDGIILFLNYVKKIIVNSPEFKILQQ